MIRWWFLLFSLSRFSLWLLVVSRLYDARDYSSSFDDHQWHRLCSMVDIDSGVLPLKFFDDFFRFVDLNPLIAFSLFLDSVFLCSFQSCDSFLCICVCAVLILCLKCARWIW
ncbi:hypothetical protein HanPSC8_Chr06g0244021 [Helianthus annuus]|nr:hypothetical protein HanPSC8_Chr06g0244021 [Helianthus annuus]